MPINPANGRTVVTDGEARSDWEIEQAKFNPRKFQREVIERVSRIAGMCDDIKLGAYNAVSSDVDLIMEQVEKLYAAACDLEDLVDGLIDDGRLK